MKLALDIIHDIRRVGHKSFIIGYRMGVTINLDDGIKIPSCWRRQGGSDPSQQELRPDIPPETEKLSLQLDRLLWNNVNKHVSIPLL